jgi:hypothetical protein
VKDKKLETFLKTLMLPKEELEGNSICPYLERYASHVKYAHVNSIDEIIQNNPIIVEDMQKEQGSTFIYVLGWEITENSHALEQIINLKKSEEERFYDKDIEILFMMKDDMTIPPLKILKKYAYTENSLLILQRKSTLKKSRNELSKNTNYYNYWGKRGANK